MSGEDRSTGAPRDRLGRPLNDLRISVTDRCNFRCPYCMPREAFGVGFHFLPREALLTFEEIERLARVLHRLGVRKIRLTGGEPLLRRDLPELVGRLAALPGIDLALTTNGSLLAQQAEALAAAGLQRVTVSLDALEETAFRRLNDVDLPLSRVLEGIAAAAAAGLTPLKLNCVVRRGWNEDQILPLVDFARREGYVMRFIEYMDVGTTNGWRLDDVVPAAEIRAAVAAVHPLETLPPRHPGEVARRFRFRDGGGEIGFIASVSEPFCGTCSRLRLAADGRLFTCLFATQGHDVKALIRGGADDQALEQALRRIWTVREDRYSELRSAATR
ncbi:MAG: GTP 3',8-cyclase MoaA, partial [Thermoanaerobaculia bacterium]